MGVPAFFRWLSLKYPKILVHCVEEKPKEVGDLLAPIDTSQPNPNDIEFDNLYLDMNGIIHPCTHPEDKPAPENEGEMMVLIFKYIDRIFSIVRPRKLLYMAIDGVAPMAKMNHRRSKKFKAAKESAHVKEAREDLIRKGCLLPPEKPASEKFDSNCISPGTPFMFRLANNLRFYIHDRLNNDPGWKNIKVILSDASVPGEGEHKIMDFIRRQRAQPHYDPNTAHCLFGADTDLIMLGLATHEPNFTIVREEFRPNQDKPCILCGQMGHTMKECTGLPKEKAGKFDNLQPQSGEDVPFIFVRLNVLKEYLEPELEMDGLSFKYDFERALDDWVFMCFFVGNDFLPHLPSLEIREGAIGRLKRVYQNTMYKTKGYLTDSGVVSLERLQLIMQELGTEEDKIFKERRQKDLEHRQRRKEDKRMRTDNHEKEDEEDSEPEDNVKLWEDGFKDRYYKQKFDVDENDVAFRHNVADHYVRGLCWVLRYYYQGCASWKWYFPYHYAPFASDFVNIATCSLSNDFERNTEPFKPFEQLMGVLPVGSKHLVPTTWQNLMTSPESPIINFYPVNFKIDKNGKKFDWQGVALLPFVDEKRLLKALDTVYPDLSSEERHRNGQGNDRLFVHSSHPAHSMLEALYEGVSKNNREKGITEEIDLNPDNTQGMAGKVFCDQFVVLTGETFHSPIPQLASVVNNKVISVQFKDPQFAADFIFKARILPNARDNGNNNRGSGNNSRGSGNNSSGGGHNRRGGDHTHRGGGHNHGASGSSGSGRNRGGNGNNSSGGGHNRGGGGHNHGASGSSGSGHNHGGSGHARRGGGHIHGDGEHTRRGSGHNQGASGSSGSGNNRGGSGSSGSGHNRGGSGHNRGGGGHSLWGSGNNSSGGGHSRGGGEHSRGGGEHTRWGCEFNRGACGNSGSGHNRGGSGNNSSGGGHIHGGGEHTRRGSRHNHGASGSSGSGNNRGGSGHNRGGSGHNRGGGGHSLGGDGNNSSGGGHNRGGGGYNRSSSGYNQQRDNHNQGGGRCNQNVDG